MGNATPIPGIMVPGDYLCDATHYFEHKGESKKVNDALVAAAAEFHADWLVSEDGRRRRVQERLSTKVKVLDYKDFIDAAHALAA